VGRKRHLLVDTLGLILEVAVTSAAVQDRDGARSVLGSLRQNWSRLTQVWADGGYAGELVNWVWGLRPQRRVHLDMVKRNELRGGFHCCPSAGVAFAPVFRVAVSMAVNQPCGLHRLANRIVDRGASGRSTMQSRRGV
jgi:transposase